MASGGPQGGRPVSISNKVQLISYPDSLGGSLSALRSLVGELFPEAAAGGIHILPPFPSSADRGFAPITYEEIDPRFGTWEDLRRIAARYPVLVDLMVNHLSRSSKQFRDFAAHGRASPFADMFITLDKVWPGGAPDPSDLERIFLRKPDNPFSDVRIEDTGRLERVWTSFGTRDWSEQVDLDVRSDATRKFFADTLALFSRMGIRAVRLDAVGYVIKKAGTSCFMVEPEIHDFLAWLGAVAAPLGLELLLEVHAHHATQNALAARGYWVYDFVLPALVLFTLFNRSSRKLRSYLSESSPRRFTMLDCHDGIPIQPDMDGVLEVRESADVVQTCVRRGANLNRILSNDHARTTGFDVHQINCTYYSALDRSDDAYIAARAIQFFSPGIPQVYYVGLLAGQNDNERVRASGEGRAINRYNYSREEVRTAVGTVVVQRLLRLIRFRNEHPAFNGTFAVGDGPDHEINLAWQSPQGSCVLTVDLRTAAARITSTSGSGSSPETITP
jgi:sucrose phosphorylase